MNYAELEYNFKECYKALSEKLDWENPEGDDYPFDLSKPLPLIMHGNLQRVPVEYFINNDLKYLQGGVLTMTYMTSTTKTKAAKYDLPSIEDMRLTLDLLCICKRPTIKRRCLLNKTYTGSHSCRGMRKYGYGYLEEVVVRRADNKLYKFKEGDFPRLWINDIEDMLLLVVQNWLKNLSGDDVADFAIALRMFTRSLVIQKPETTRPGLKKRQPYTPYKNPQGFIYVDDNKQNRLMRSDELYKFSDGTLTRLRDSLDDITKNINLEYLPKRRWSTLEKKRAQFMIKDINKLLKERRMMRTGNLVKEILFKLSLPDHRSILTDSKIHLKMVKEIFYMYLSRKIRRIYTYTHQRPRRKLYQYALSREDQYAVLEIRNVKILEDIKCGPYSKKPQYAVSKTLDMPKNDKVFNDEISRLSGMDNDLFTYEVEVTNTPCDSNTDNDSEQRVSHEADDDMGYDPSNIRGDDEAELTDEESSDNEDKVAEKEPTSVKHHCKPFNYKTGSSEWPTSSWREDGYCNGGNLPSTYVIGNSLHYQDLSWYEALEDSKLKEEALRNKAIMEGLIKEDDNDKSRYEQRRRWNMYTNYDDAYEINHEVKEREELCEIHKPPVCNIRRFEMIKYSFGQDEEFVAIKEDEYDDLVRTSEDACRAYQEIFRMMDEGWMDLVKRKSMNVGGEFTKSGDSEVLES
ncbi:hypothetical protein Tco_0340223 [Tanacetum coccineum]